MRLTIRQFRLLYAQSLVYEEKKKLALAESVRVAFHADKEGWIDWVDFERGMTGRQMKKERKKTKTKVVGKADLASLGLTDKKR